MPSSRPIFLLGKMTLPIDKWTWIKVTNTVASCFWGKGIYNLWPPPQYPPLEQVSWGEKVFIPEIRKKKKKKRKKKKQITYGLSYVCIFS